MRLGSVWFGLGFSSHGFASADEYLDLGADAETLKMHDLTAR